MILFRQEPDRRYLRGQLIWFLIWLFVTACAIYLHARPDGHGTHTELGLPPCPSVMFFGRPCPGCGLTTSFTATVHGDLPFAFRAHPFGPLLYLILAVTGWMGLIGWIKKVRIETNTPAFARASCVFVCVFMAFGIARFILSPHYGDHDLAHLAYTQAMSQR